MNQLLLFARVEVNGMHLPYVPALGGDINMSRMTQYDNISFPQSASASLIRLQCRFQHETRYRAFYILN